jgi:glucan phosphoethanolaminetransferase (alkaline phosphatase superfamily)
MYKFPQEVLGKTTLKEYVSKYVESLYKNIIKKDDLNEFDKFIIMIHDEVIGTIMPSFLKDRDDRIENKNNKPKKNIRHKSRNNLV